MLQTTQIISDVCFMLPCCLRQLKNKNKNKIFELRRNSSSSSSLPGVDASPVYVRAWELDSFHSLISTQTPSTGLRHPSLEEGAGKRCSESDQYPNLSEGADHVGGQLRGDKECPFSGVT